MRNHSIVALIVSEISAYFMGSETLRVTGITIGEQMKIQITLEAFKHALKYILTNRINRQSANHDEQLERSILSTSR